jgi:cathepsin B
LVTLAVLASAENEKLITREKLEALKEVAKFDVLDYEDHPFKDLTKDDLIKKLGLMKDNSIQLRNIMYGETTQALPRTFNSKDKWPQCIHPIRDQQNCGSCWAFSSSEVLSDRMCIATGGAVDVVMSPQDMVSCDYGASGCNGGYINQSWEYIKNYGIVADSCLPYTSGQTGTPGACPFIYSQSCVYGTYRKYRVYSHQQFYTIASAKEAIFNWGPIQAGFQIYEDFMNYRGGVYRRTSNNLIGGHAIKIVGWGVDYYGYEYWIVANSWNSSWGEQGYFRIAFGECGIEDQLWAGYPYVEANDKFLIE